MYERYNLPASQATRTLALSAPRMREALTMSPPWPLKERLKIPCIALFQPSGGWQNETGMAFDDGPHRYKVDTKGREPASPDALKNVFFV